MKLTTIAVATAVGAALALGSVVPAQAAGEAVSINPLAPVTAPLSGSTSVPITVNVSAYGAGVYYAYVDVTVVSGSHTLYANKLATTAPGANGFTVDVPYYATVGNYTVTATLQTADGVTADYTTAATTPLTIKGHATFAALTGKGKKGSTFHIRGKVANKGELAGSKIKVYVAKKGHKKFKKVDSAKIKANGKFKLDSKKIQIGDRIYFRIKGKGLIVNTKSATYKIKRIF
jgi:hypothetical protein